MSKEWESGRWLNLVDGILQKNLAASPLLMKRGTQANSE